VPEPPRIDCSERAPVEPLPALPVFEPLPALDAGGEAWRAYVTRRDRTWTAYSVGNVGAYEAVVGQRVVTADCLDNERAAKRIR
jgi:hypothetical protein